MKRADERNKRAEAVCRELRYQLVKNGRVLELGKLYALLCSWMRVANKNKYDRPGK